MDSTNDQSQSTEIRGQQYVGTKIVSAWRDEKDGQPGYAVKYADGYTSWSPKAVFEEAYLPIGIIKELHPHQQRVIAEKAQLDNRDMKLRVFFATSAYASLNVEEQDRLRRQRALMAELSEVLGDRIAAFIGPTP